MILTFFVLVLLQVVGAPDIVSLFTPLVVMLVTELLKWAIPKLQGWIVVTFIVPLFSILVTWVTTLIANPEMTFWIQVVYGLLAVVINELYRQLKQRFSNSTSVTKF